MKTQRWWLNRVASGSFGVLAVWFAACSGGDIPPVDNELRGNLEQAYPGDPEPTGNAGAAGAGGDGGAAGAAGAGGDEPSSGGGAAGTGGSAPVAGGGTGGGGTLDPNVCDAYTTIFSQKCSGGNCHGAGALNGNFAESAEAALDLVDKVSTRGEACGVLIDPADTENSLILTMTNGESDPGACFPVIMPLGGDDLTPDEQDCITEWLSQFAD